MYLNGTKCAALALGCFLSVSLMAKNTVPKVGQDAQKPLCFIENKGQVADPSGKPCTDIQYKMSTPGMNLYVGNGQLHYQFRKTEKNSYATPSVKTYRMDVTLLGANPYARVLSSEKQAYFENYYTAATGPAGVTALAYNRITYQEVYPGIDWVLYVKGDQVEYDFVVRPGADASLIKLQYGGATALGIGHDGGITAETPMGKVQEKKPYAYETATGREVAANFKLHNNVVSFETGKCNGTLTIDPFILWSTYFGGAAEDVATCVKVSGGGNIYIGGYTTSTTVGLGTPPNPFDVTSNGGVDAFITRYDVAGVRTFTTYFGGTGTDNGTCLAIDAAGTSIYLGGVTNSTGLATGGAYDGTLTGPTDGFIFKVSNTGARQWSTYYGGAASVPLGLSGNDQINGITVDGAGNVYATGRTEGTGLATGGVYQAAVSGGADAFVAKFTAAGAITFSTYYGGTGVDEGAGVTFDGTNNVIITGQTNSVINMVSIGAYDTVLGGTQDAFVAKLNTTGTTRMWGTYFGGAGSEQGTDIICNTVTGAVGLIGYTSSASGISTPNAHQTAYGGGTQDAFVAYLTTGGGLTWSTYYGGSLQDYGESICLDPFRNIVVSGSSFSANNIASAGSLQPALAGNYDAFVTKFTPLGQRIWGTYFGGALYDYAYGVACDGSGQIIFAGHTTSTAGIATVGSAQPANAGGTYDAFVTKFRPDTFALINQPFVDTLMCAGGPLRLNYTVSIAHQPGNIFTAQLSNAAGSFSSVPAPVTIGTLAATGSGVILCTINPATPAGTNYRIRILASNPGYTSPDQFVNIRIVSSLPAVTLTANTPVCVGNDLTLNATATWSIATYTWAGPAGTPIASVANPTLTSVTLADEGVYSLTTTHNGCPDNVATINVDVNDVTPPSPIAFASALNCDGGSISLFADTAAASVTGSYSWSGPASFSSTSQNPVISPITSANAGDYYVVDTIDGCPSLATTVNVAVTATTPVSISISVSPNDTVCGGTTVSFSTSTFNGGISPTFQWMNNSLPVVGAMSPTWSSSTLTDGAMISCVMNSNAVCPSPISAVSNTIKMNVISAELLVHIFAVPGVSVPPGDSITFTSVVYNAGVGPTYQWQRNGNDIPGATNAIYKKYNVTAFDTITLVVTSTMACVTPSIAKSNALVAHPNTAVIGLYSLPDNIELYPNPNPGSFTVKGNFEGTGVEHVAIVVMNPLGQVVFSDNAALTSQQLNKDLRIDHLANGVYLLQLNADGMSKTIRFSVQR